MYQFFVEPDQIDVAGKSVIIRGADVNHIKNVLRMRPGEEVAVSNGIDGREYRCGILALEEDCVRLELRFIKEDGVELPAKIYLFQGLPKADKMEWIVQKSTELGTAASADGSLLKNVPSSYVALYGSQKMKYIRITASYGSNMGVGDFNIYAK